jgi:hypothetical protein
MDCRVCPDASNIVCDPGPGAHLLGLLKLIADSMPGSRTRLAGIDRAESKILLWKSKQRLRPSATLMVDGFKG